MFNKKIIEQLIREVTLLSRQPIFKKGDKCYYYSEVDRKNVVIGNVKNDVISIICDRDGYSSRNRISYDVIDEESMEIIYNVGEYSLAKKNQ